MPDQKPTRQRVSGFSPEARSNAGSSRATTQVVARPARSDIVAPDNALASLAKALDAVNPTIGKIAQQHREEQARIDYQRGQQAQRAGEDYADNASAAWQQGYKRLAGFSLAQERVKELREEYTTKASKDGSAFEFDKFVAEWWQKQSRGIDDADYLEGYSAPIQEEITKLRQEHFTGALEELKDRQLAAASEYLAANLKELPRDAAGAIDQVKAGKLLSDLKNDLRVTFGTTGKELNHLVYETLLDEAKQGRFEVWQLARLKNADGTPGLYFVPEYRQKIMQAELASMNEYVRINKEAAEAAEKQRIAEQDAQLVPVAQLALSTRNPVAAQQALRQTFQKFPGLFGTADMAEWESKIMGLAAMPDIGPQQGVRATELLAGISSGKTTEREILTAGHKQEIGFGQVQSLLNDLEKFRKGDDPNRERVKSNMQHPAFIAARERIQGLLNAEVGEYGSELREVLRQQQEIAVGDLYRIYLDPNMDPMQAAKVADEIIKPFVEYRKQLKEDAKNAAGLFNPNYQKGLQRPPMKLKDAREAADRGLITQDEYHTQVRNRAVELGVNPDAPVPAIPPRHEPSLPNLPGATPPVRPVPQAGAQPARPDGKPQAQPSAAPQGAAPAAPQPAQPPQPAAPAPTPKPAPQPAQRPPVQPQPAPAPAPQPPRSGGITGGIEALGSIVRRGAAAVGIRIPQKPAPAPQKPPTQPPPDQGGKPKVLQRSGDPETKRDTELVNRMVTHAKKALELDPSPATRAKVEAIMKRRLNMTLEELGL